LRPARSARAPVENEPKPTSCTVSPRVTERSVARVSPSPALPRASKVR
jgi:hypothetical protein